MYCILFTALCGSFVKDANYKSLRIVDKIHDPAEAQAMEAGGRFIDDRLPSSRLPELLAWMGNYVERGGKIPEEWTDNWELVCSAHRHLWGTTPVDEIRMDIASDQRLIEQIAEGDPTLKVEAHPFNCFVDLVRIRSTLADLLDKDPGAILEPLRICQTIDRHVTVPIYHVFPDGTSGPVPGTEPIIEDVIEVPDRMARALARQRPDLTYPPAAGTRIAEQLRYSAWELRTGQDVSSTLGLKAREAWPTLLGFFAPFYKLALYGLRYRTMLEYDLVKARRFLDANRANLLWNDYYLSVSDVSSPVEYFHFYAIDEADCDMCSRRTRADAGVIVSANTLRDSPAFVAYYRSKFDDLADYFALGRDWSVWLLCLLCYHT